MRQKYNNYKNSGCQWLGEIPCHWQILKVKHLFEISKDVNNQDDPQILSLTQKGIKVRDITTNIGQIAESYENYRKINKGDIVLNPMDLLSGFVDESKFDGVISPAYTTLKKTKDINTTFYNYFFQKHYYEKIFFPFGEGVSVDHRWTLKDFVLMNFPVVAPPKEEQDKIVNFLNNKLEKIDQILKKNDKLLELLEEKQRAMITQTVIGGLDRHTEMKDSGVEWIGKIPKNWKLQRIKSVVSNRIGGLWGANKQNDNNDIFCVRVADFDYVNFRIKEPSTIRNVSEKDISSKILKDGDILIEKSGGGDKHPVGRILTYKGKSKSVCSNFIEKVTLEKHILPDFFMYFNYFLYSSKINTRSIKQTTGIQNLDIDSYFKELICLPSIEEQRNIVNYINEKNVFFNKIRKLILTKNKKLEKYYQSLISNTVTGKIKV